MSEETGLNQVLARAMGNPGIVIKSIAVAEILDREDGERKLVVLGDECPLWDAVGMLKVVSDDLVDTYVQAPDSSHG